MPPESSERLLLAGIRRQADQRDLERRDLAHRLLLQPGMLADRHDDVLGDAEGGEQRAVLELHAGAGQHLALGLAVQGAGIDPQHLDRTLARAGSAR